MDNAPRVLAGRYEVGELIGRGGMAEVHIGHDTRLGRTVAIKILRSDLARDPSFLARFRREAQAAAALNHPAIVAVYDTGEDIHTEPGGGTAHVPFIVMEYVEGHTVRDIINDGQAVPIDEAVEITAGVLSALEYSHHAGIVHRDIKPANVMITPTGAIKVMDFGIARAIADSAATMTQSQAVIGTAQYLSPEQARGETVDARSDLYSTGCLLFELLTGRPPFIGDSPVAVAYQHVREAPAKPSDLAPDVPEVLDRITLKALAKERTARYSSAAEFRSDLENAVRGGQITAPSLAVAAAGAAGLAAGAATTQLQSPVDSTQIMSPANAAGNPWDPTPPAVVPLENGQGPEEEEHKRRGLMWTLITIGVLAVAAIVTFLLLNQGEKTPETVAVPTITVEMTPEQAAAAITDVGLRPVQLIDAESDLPEGKFTKQDPAANTQVEPDSVVNIYYSNGPNSVTVPNVKNLSQADARKAIEAANLTVGPTVTPETSIDVAQGNVTKTDPEADKSVPAGTEISLFISNGLVTLPPLTGMTQEEADKTLGDLKLDSSFSTEESDQPADKVFKQSPSPGDVAQGTRVQVTIAVAPTVEKTAVPDSLPGMTLDEATAALGSVQLNLGTTTERASETIPAGIVISSDPGPNAEVDEGSKVNLVVSSGPAGGTPTDPGTGADGSDADGGTDGPGGPGGDAGGNAAGDADGTGDTGATP